MTVERIIALSAAALTPIVAIAGLLIGTLNYRLSVRKRKDELFDRRYAFYQRARRLWLASGDGAAPEVDPELHFEDLVPMAEEASLLFGEDISKHILSLEGKGHRGSPFFPDADFTKPFEKHLKF